jgi:hypothetical protein
MTWHNCFSFGLHTLHTIFPLSMTPESPVFPHMEHLRELFSVLILEVVKCMLRFCIVEVIGKKM